MRIKVLCPSGEARLLQVSPDISVLELKQILEEQEGIPVKQQVICFGGQHLKDHASIREYNLDEFTLSDEVVLYLSSRLSSPKAIFLTSWSKPSQLVQEHVEADMPVGEVADLLESRLLARACPGASIIIKRQDGSTVPITVDPAEGLAHLEARIARQEKLQPTAMTFCQAQDGSLHCTVTPSHASSYTTYPVYQRSLLPQPEMSTQPSRPTHQPLTALSKELCVLP